MAAKDNKEKEAALPEGQAEKPKKKSKAKKIVIILALLLMIFGGCGLAAYWWFFLRAPGNEVADAGLASPGVETPVPSPQEENRTDSDLNKAKIERQSALPRSAGLVLPLPPITVNLQDPNGRRYLKLGLEVEVNSDVSSQLKANSSRIRDAIIMLLAGKSYGDVATPDGKLLLKAEIGARLNQILGAQRVVRVYFTDFVVE